MRRALHHRYGRAEGRRIEAKSFERYNGGVRIKRQWGSSTVTRFYVYFADDRHDPSKWEKIEAYGKTPGERKTFAIQKFVQKRNDPYVAGVPQGAPVDLWEPFK